MVKRIFGKNGPVLHEKNLGRNHLTSATYRKKTPRTPADAERLAAAAAKRARKAAKAAGSRKAD